LNKRILFVLVLVLLSAMAPAVIAEDINAEIVEEPEEGAGNGLECVTEGESIPVIAEPLECCEGLTLIPPTEEGIVGISGYCTALCGDGECGEIETAYNCSADCEDEPEAETEEDEDESEDGVNPETGEAIVDAATSREVAAMELGIGAKIRLLQLEKSILKNILHGEVVIEFINENFEGEDTNELVGLLEELRVLKDEVANTDSEGEKEEIVKQFVDLKNDAIALSKGFREATHEILEGIDKQGIQDKFKEIDMTELQELMDEIRELIREFNAQRVERTFQNLGVKGLELANRVRNSEIKMNGVKAAVGQALKALEPQKRNKAFTGLKEENAKKRVFVQSKVLEAKNQFLERRVERLENRIQAIKGNSNAGIAAEKIKERIQNRIINPVRTPRPPVNAPRVPDSNGQQNGAGNATDNNAGSGTENSSGNGAQGGGE